MVTTPMEEVINLGFNGGVRLPNNFQPRRGKAAQHFVWNYTYTVRSALDAISRHLIRKLRFLQSIRVRDFPQNLCP
jgi:hypothetical protein